jgi:ATP/maltotriose-dependent transcriptional regulator MalT
MMIPPPRRGELVRARLHRMLQTPGSRCTTVVAPAGWGKSTLLAAWARDPAQQGAVGWVSLDEGDDEPVRFWTYALSALATVAPRVAHDALAALSGQGLDPVNVALEALLNALSEAEGEYVLVLDDYHRLHEQRIHESVEFLLSYLPPTLRLVIASRVDPPLPLARLRARGELIEVRMADLACTPAEAAALVGNVEESARDAAGGLVERTEGWPAGLHLAALTLRGTADPVAAARAIRGDHRHILDYFIAEVLPALDDAARELLVHCSVLERLSGPLCDAVLDTTGSGPVLDRLERAEVFVSALGPSREWYRCHQLFRDVLQRELDTTSPGAAQQILRRAADWYLDEGRVDEAVHHRIAAGDRERALELLLEHDRWFVDNGAMPDLLQLGERLADQCASNVLACLWLALAAGLCWRPESVARWLDLAEPLLDAEPRPDPEGRGSLRASADALRAYYGLPGDVEAALHYARRAFEHEDDPTKWTWVGARFALGKALHGAGQIAEQVAVLEEAWTSPVLREQPAQLLLMAAGDLALGLIDLGKIDRARRICAEVAATAVATEQAWGPGAAPAIAELRLAEARIAVVEQGAAAGLPALRRAVELADTYGRGAVIVAASTSLAAALWAVGDRAGARVALDRAREVAADDPPDPHTAAGLADLEMRIGRLAGAHARARGALVEELTDRELAVLRALRGPLTAREIGQELCLSINTIKSYTKSLYRKLGVVTRADAVARGRDLGLT